MKKKIESVRIAPLAPYLGGQVPPFKANHQQNRTNPT